MMDELRLRSLLDQFPKTHVLVVGDFFLDLYMDIDRALSETSATPIIAEPALHLHNTVMTTKEIALKTIEQLPENVSWEDIQARINFVVGVYKGLRELEEGKGIRQDKVKEEFADWLTN